MGTAAQIFTSLAAAVIGGIIAAAVAAIKGAADRTLSHHREDS